MDDYLVEGAGELEYGPDGDQRHESGAGECFYISPGAIHRDVNPTNEDNDLLVCFVDSGPVVLNVDDPTADCRRLRSMTNQHHFD